jgi:drug/metabolite transporter (DMT)-like permease
MSDLRLHREPGIAALKPPMLSPGIRAMAIGAFWFSIMGLLVKLAGRRLPSMEVVLFRVVITLVLSWLTLRQLRIRPMLGHNRRLLLLRGLLGSMGLMCYYYSLVHLPLGEATLLQHTNPIFATLIAAWFVDERAGRREIRFLATAMLGVVLITRPTSLFGAGATTIAPLSVAIGVMGALFSGAAYATIRYLSRSEHAAVMVLYLPMVALPITVPLTVNLWVMPSGWEWVILLGVGIATQLAQVFLTRGLAAETAARATTTGYLQLVFAGVWGALIFGERPTGWTLGGAALIVWSAWKLAFGRPVISAAIQTGVPGAAATRPVAQREEDRPA